LAPLTSTDRVPLDREIVALVRAYEPDRYLAALAAPAEARNDLLALAAFAAEVRRIPRLVHDPLVGEIRLTWWRDAIEGLAKDAPAGHPVADRLAGPIQSGVYPVPRLTGFLDAMAYDLSPAPFADDRAREVYLGKTEGVLFRLGLRRLGATEDQHDPMILVAAIAYGLARAGLTRGQISPLATEADLIASGLAIPAFTGDKAHVAHATLAPRLAPTARMALDQSRALVEQLPAPLRPAMLPLTMAAPYLRWSEWPGGPPSTAPMLRVWRIWRTARTGRLGY
jgi:phytoene synthase